MGEGVFLQQQCQCTQQFCGWCIKPSECSNLVFIEGLLFPFLSSLKPSTVSLPDSITLTISPSLILPGTLDSFLTQNCHLIKICQTAYFELKRISSIRRFLTEDATKMQGNTAVYGVTYILSRLHYCNCLLMGTPNSVIQPLQKIQTFAARLVLLAPHHPLSTPLLEKKLHWLPIS